jgi:hypothetical protein
VKVESEMIGRRYRPQRTFFTLHPSLFTLLSYLTLTVLVWGVNAFQRGLWQDDVQALGEAFQRSTREHWFRALFAPDASPLRRLTLLPSAIAYATPQPIWALHILCGAVWLAQALAAGWIVSLLLPGRRWTRFAVVCLTLTATSDFTFGSIVALAYNVAALYVLAATGCALVWLGRGRIVVLVASVILLTSSLLTMDVAWPAVPFLILLFVLGGRQQRRRAIALLITWGIALVPLAVVEWSFLHDPTSYAAMALVPVPKRVLITRAIVLWLDNFAPWRWPFARPEWYLRPPAVIAGGWMAAGSLLAASLFLLCARTKSDDSAAVDGRQSVRLAAFFATMALAVNATYAAVWFSDIHYRTHILSRVWASAAIGMLAGWAFTSKPRLRLSALLIVTAFVFFGTWGGMERQDYFLATWQRHQRELTSILRAAPSLRPGTAVILRSSTTSGQYLATEAGYLTKHWLRLLYDDPRLRTMRLNPERGSGCRPAEGAIDCWLEGQGPCIADKTCKPIRFGLEELVMMDYDAQSGTYQLVRSLRGDPLAQGFEAETERYRPESRIVAGPWTLRQSRLLLKSKE